MARSIPPPSSDWVSPFLAARTPTPSTATEAVRPAAPAAVLRAATLGLTLLEALAALVDWSLLTDVRCVLAGAALVLAATIARPMWRALALGFAVVGLLLISTRSAPGTAYEVYRSGMLTVTPVVALLVTVTRLNDVVLAGRYNIALAAFLARSGRKSWSRLLPVLLAYGLAPVLLAGALTQSYGPFQGAGSAADDRRLLAVSMRALSLGLVWSPMAAPTAFALTLLDVPVASYLIIALPASVLAFLMLLFTSRHYAAAVRPELREAQDPAKVARLMAFLAALPVLVGVLAAVRGEVSLQVVLLAMLSVTAAWTVLDRLTDVAAAAPRRDRDRDRDKAGLAPEGVALYLSLGLFVGGVRLVTGDAFSWAETPTVAIAVAFLGSATCFLLGVHPVAVIAVLSPTVLALPAAYAAVGAFALCAGAQAVNVSSPFSPLSVVGSQMVRATPWQVSTPVHWRFSLQQLALYGAVCAAALWSASAS